MLDTRETRKLKAGMLKIWVIWIAMFLTILLSLVIAFVLRQTDAVRYDLPTVRKITTILYGASLIGLGLAYFIRRYMLKRATTRSVSEDNSDNMSNLISSPYIDVYSPIVIVSLAISESIGALGLTVFFMSRDMTTLLIFLAISAFGLFYFRPKFEEIERLTVAIKQNS